MGNCGGARFACDQISSLKRLIREYASKNSQRNMYAPLSYQFVSVCFTGYLIKEVSG